MSREFLVVDSRAIPVDALRAGLREIEMTPVQVGEGLAALRLIEEMNEGGCGFSGILTSVCLPDMEGLTFATVVKARYPGIPVLMFAERSAGLTPEDPEVRQTDGLFPVPIPVDAIIRRFLEIGAAPERLTPTSYQAPPDSQACALLRLRCKPAADRRSLAASLAGLSRVRVAEALAGSDEIMVVLSGPDHEAIRVSARPLLDHEGVSAGDLIPGGRSVPEGHFLAPFLEAFRWGVLTRRCPEAPVGSGASVAVVPGGANECSKEFLLVSTELVACEGIHAKLTFMPGVRFCEAVTGEFSLFVLVETPKRAEIEQIVQRLQVYSPGLLGIRRFPVL